MRRERPYCRIATRNLSVKFQVYRVTQGLQCHSTVQHPETQVCGESIAQYLVCVCVCVCVCAYPQHIKGSLYTCLTGYDIIVIGNDITTNRRLQTKSLPVYREL